MEEVDEFYNERNGVPYECAFSSTEPMHLDGGASRDIEHIDLVANKLIELVPAPEIAEQDWKLRH
jgi:hypothetical protein